MSGTASDPRSERLLLEPEEILARQAYEIPRVRLPARGSLFAGRAARLRRLAQGHTLADYLGFVAAVAEAQQACLLALSDPPLPPAEKQEQNREFGMPVLNALTLHRDPVWRAILRDLLARLVQLDLPAELKATLERFAGQSDDYFEAQASKLLASNLQGLNVAVAPLLAAALQVYWVAMATALGEEAFPQLPIPNVCPCCGTRPTASVARIGAAEAGYRYLHCALCATEWHMVRVKCANCESTKDIHYQSIDDGRPGREHAIKAECCDACNTYLKVLYMERDAEMEACADDLASITLDVLVSETGRPGSGVNYMLVQGNSGTP